MPRCLMAKKWKAYPWPDRQDDDETTSVLHQDMEPGELIISEDITDTVHQEQRRRLVNDTEDEEIDVVGDSTTITTIANSQQDNIATVLGNDNTTSIGGNSSASGSSTSNNLETGGNRASQQTCWGPHSPTAGATAPSPPPLNASGALYYHGYTHEAWLNHEEPPKYATLRSAAELARPNLHSPTPCSRNHHQQLSVDLHQDQQAVTANNDANSGVCGSSTLHQGPPSSPSTSLPSTTTTALGNLPPRKSLAMCYTSTGTALSLPPKKKDIYRPYSLQTCTDPIIRSAAEEDLSAAQAILDLSASPAAPTHSVFIHTLSPPPPPLTSPLPAVAVSVNIQQQQQQQQPQQQQPAPIPVSVLVPVPTSPHNSASIAPSRLQHEQHQHHHQSSSESSPEPQSPATADGCSSGSSGGGAGIGSLTGSGRSSPSGSTSSGNKTVAYTYEAFFVSDGRSKRRSSNAAVPEKEAATPDRPKFTCTECGKQYATSSNLSRHKQTHRSLDSQSAKKCIHCGKAYVSMPALAMHVLTHKLAHSCGVCGKMFSRPWLLQGHLRSHTGEKPYGCAHCGKAFADRSNLRAHMQTHSADKNYECSRCHKTFALKSYLNKHLESACLRDEDMQPNGGQGSPAANNGQINRGL